MEEKINSRLQEIEDMVTVIRTKLHLGRSTEELDNGLYELGQDIFRLMDEVENLCSEKTEQSEVNNT